MPSFGELFTASKGKPIKYKGQDLSLVDILSVEQGERIRVVFESFGSDWRQGVMLRAPGPIEVAGESINGPVVLWQDTAPREVDLVVSKKGELRVKNVWDRGNGVVDSGHNGAAIIVEELPNGRRYRCNDGHPDEDFDDIVFRLERPDR